MGQSFWTWEKFKPGLYLRPSHPPPALSIPRTRGLGTVWGRGTGHDGVLSSLTQPMDTLFLFCLLQGTME